MRVTARRKDWVTVKPRATAREMVKVMAPVVPGATRR
jgi:hypothetical protein